MRGDIVRIVPLNVREVEGFDVPVFDRNRVVLVWFQVFLQPFLKAHIDKFQRRFPGFLALNALIVLCGDRDLLFLLPRFASAMRSPFQAPAQKTSEALRTKFNAELTRRRNQKA